MQTSTSLAKVSALEAQLNESIGSRAGVVAAITERITKAEAVLAAFNDDSSPGGIDAAIKASGIVDGGRRLLAGFGQDVRAWEDGVRHRWLAANYTDLVDHLESHVTAEAAKRGTFRESMAERIGSLSKKLVLQEGLSTEAELSAIARELATIEADLQRREARLTAATGAIRDLRRAPAPRWDLWKNSRSLVEAVEFPVAL